MTKLQGKTIFVTGASRGIGKAIALRAAADGANIAVVAKPKEAHPKLPGTIYSAAQEIEDAGGHALPLAVDIRDEAEVALAVTHTVETFGGIDMLVNNASAISLTNTEHTPIKRFDLMFDVNVRGTFLCSQSCIPHLRKSSSAHILNIAPPPNLDAKWFQNHVAYTIAKYGMSLCVLGMAEELRADSIAVNALWPQTVIKTAALAMLPLPIKPENCRKPAIMADAAYEILCLDPKTETGHFYIDEEILRRFGIKDFDKYRAADGGTLISDLFLNSDGDK